MFTDDAGDREYAQATEQRIMSDDEFENIRATSDDDFAAMTSERRIAFFSTTKWHAAQRIQMDSLEGIRVGGKTVDEVLHQVVDRNEEAGRKNPPAVTRLPLTPEEVRKACVAYMIDCALDRDENDEVKPQAKKLMEKTTAILNDPTSFNQLVADLNAAERLSLDDLPVFVDHQI